MKTTKEKHCQREKRNNQTIKHNPFPKTLLLQQSNTTTKEKQQHQQTQDPPRVLHGLDRTGFARVVGVESELLELIGLDQWFSFTLSCSQLKLNWVLLGLGRTWVLLELSFAWVCWREELNNKIKSNRLKFYVEINSIVLDLEHQNWVLWSQVVRYQICFKTMLTNKIVWLLVLFSKKKKGSILVVLFWSFGFLVVLYFLVFFFLNVW